MPTKELSQMNIKLDVKENQKLTNETRLDNIELDLINQFNTLEILVKQNNKYANYLDERILSEKESHDFWVDIRKRLLTAGILGVLAILGSAMLYAASQWIKNH